MLLVYSLPCIASYKVFVTARSNLDGFLFFFPTHNISEENPLQMHSRYGSEYWHKNTEIQRFYLATYSWHHHYELLFMKHLILNSANGDLILHIFDCHSVMLLLACFDF